MMWIRIEALKIEMFVGVLPHEYEGKQEIVLDIGVETVTDNAGLSDNLADTVDYAALAQTIEGWLNAKHFHLIEHAAQTVLNHLMALPLVQNASVRLAKPGAVSNAAAAVVEVASC